MQRDVQPFWWNSLITAGPLDKVGAVWFTTAVSEFDQYLASGKDHTPGKNRLRESIALWGQLSPYYLTGSRRDQLFLVFTKIDSLRDKLKRGVSFRKHFPEYKSDDNTYDSVISFIRGLCDSVSIDTSNRDPNAKWTAPHYIALCSFDREAVHNLMHQSANVIISAASHVGL